MPMLNFTAPQINEKQLEEELANMTEHEKEEQYRDLYGQEKDLDLDLTPELIDELLEKTTTEIRGMRLKNGYKMAMEKCPDVVLDRDFQLEFLESVQYDPKLAAAKIVQYWDAKKEVFGVGDLFTKPRISLNDLDEQDLFSIYNSVFMILPCTDTHGRPIIFSTRPGWAFRKAKNMRKALWYMLETLREIPESRSKGVVVIAYDMGSFDMAKASRKVDTGAVRMAKGIPSRLSALHHVADSRLLRMIWPFVMFVMGRKNRQRVVDHNPRKDGWLQGFGDYGISIDNLPKVMGGTLEFNQKEWLDERRAKGL